MGMTITAQLWIVALGAGWTVLAYFLKRTLEAIDRKLEEHRRQADAAARQLDRLGREMERRSSAMQADLARTLAARRGACQRHYVSRQEFGAFTATMNHKMDSIYEILKPEERTKGQ